MQLNGKAGVVLLQVSDEFCGDISDFLDCLYNQCMDFHLTYEYIYVIHVMNIKLEVVKVYRI